MLLTLRIPTWPAQRFLLTTKNRQDIHGAQGPAPSPTHPPTPGLGRTFCQTHSTPGKEGEGGAAAAQSPTACSLKSPEPLRGPPTDNRTRRDLC